MNRSRSVLFQQAVNKLYTK